MGWTDLVNRRNDVVGIVGDPAWDLAGSYIDDMVKLYHEKFGRLVTLGELISCVEFAYGGTAEEYLEKHPEPLTPDS
jgi:hypothetical protein